MEDFYIGQIFEGMYPKEASDWCCYQTENTDKIITIIDIEPQNGIDRFQIVDITLTEDELIQQRKETFENDFILTSWGWFRKEPKGYSNAPQSIDVIFNMVNIMKGFTEQVANLMIFYTEPDFTDPEQCTEEWLVAHQVKHEPCTLEEFMTFYVDFQTRWANELYKQALKEQEENVTDDKEPIEE